MSDMREALGEALDAAAEDDETQNFEETQQEVLTDEEESTETETTEGTEEAEPDIAADAGTGTSETTDRPKGNPGDSIKAPVDWGPKEREAWSSIPRHLQDKVMQREKDMASMMQNTSAARRTHDQFNSLTQQYGSVLSGVMGGSPMEAVSTLFSTISNLRMGSQDEKAQIISNMINTFGVDINALDSAIVGQAPSPEQSQSQEVQRLVQQQMAPFQEMLGQQNAYKQQQQRQQAQQANSEVQTFAQKAEFLGDVRHQMADLIDMGSARGENITMERAYSLACMSDPRIQSVLQERQKKAQLQGNNNTMAGKRAAASSLGGQRIGGGGGNGAQSMRDMISSAWDTQGQM